MTDIDQTTASTIDVDEVRCSVEEVLDALAETMPVLLEAPPTADPSAAGATYRGSIAIIGDQPATAHVTVNGSTCIKLALGWSMVEGDDGPTLEDATDAMGEFVNIVGGSVKAIFDAESSLGLPEVEVIPAQAGPGPADPTAVLVDHPIGSVWIRVDDAS